MDHLFKNQFYVYLADLLIMLVSWFVLQNRTQSTALEVSQAAAAAVPGLQKVVKDISGRLHEAKGEISGMQGQLAIAKEKLTQAKHDGESHRSIVAGKDQQIGMYQTTVKELTSQLSDIKKHFRAGPPVTLLVMIDVTQSMEHLINDLQEALAILFETLPNTSKDFQVGVIAFRAGVVEELPIMQVLPTYEDLGTSQQQVLSFVGSLRVQQSHVDYRPVFERAGGMLKKAHPTPDPKRKVRLVLISDTGCGEADDQLGYSAEEVQLKNDLVRSVQMWAAQGDRGVAALYAESENSRREGADQQLSQQWFIDLGSVSEKSASYTNSNHLLRAVLRASFD